MEDFKETADRNPFRVPENYFEDLNERIKSSSEGIEQVKKNKGLYHRMRPFLAAAASVALLFALSYISLKIFRPSSGREDLPEISLQEFTDTYLDEIDIFTIEEVISPVAFYEEIPDVSNNDIIDYLLLENIKLNDIYEIL